jgi:uncharacterized protein YifE (UPF0438 family)
MVAMALSILSSGDTEDEEAEEVASFLAVFPVEEEAETEEEEGLEATEIGIKTKE